jgi:hypothetical protein
MQRKQIEHAVCHYLDIDQARMGQNAADDKFTLAPISFSKTNLTVAEGLTPFGFVPFTENS